MYYNKPWRNTHEDFVIQNAINLTDALNKAITLVQKSQDEADVARITGNTRDHFRSVDKCVYNVNHLMHIAELASDALLNVVEVIQHPKRGTVAESVSNRLFQALTRAARYL